MHAISDRLRIIQDQRVESHGTSQGTMQLRELLSG